MIWPNRDDILVDVLTGETLGLLERWNHSHNPFYAEVRGWTGSGLCWIRRLKLLRPAMPAERRKFETAWRFRRIAP